MTDKPWKLVLLLTGIFVAGGITGSFVTVRVVRNWAKRVAQPEQWGPNRLDMLTKRLDLTPEQIERIRPLIKRDMEDLAFIRQTGFREARRILERMELDIAAELTPPQKEKFDQLNKEFRERMQRFIHTPGGPGGPRPRGGPPPADQPQPAQPGGQEGQPPPKPPGN
jgi:Spy/CpxP family protein refolding chaperone